MANLSKIKRDQMLAFLEELKSKNNDDDSIRAINEIENQLRSKKYGLVWEEHSEQVDEMLKENIPVLIADEERRLCKNPELPWNFIIEGDNLQALYLLEKTHKGKIDCIYIDPPYNTGAHDWKYNNDYVDEEDAYRHSKWLSMMKNRLLIAKNLLNPICSVLICTIDEKEYLSLGCLLEEIFPNANMQMVSSIIKSGTSMRQYEFSRCNEYIYYLRFGSAVIEKEIPENTDQAIPWRPLMRSGTGSNNFRPARPNSFYPIYVNKETCKVEEIGASLELNKHPSDIKNKNNFVALWPLKKDGTEMVWGLSADTLKNYLKNGYAKVTLSNGKYGVQYITTGVIDDIESGKIEIIGKDSNGGVIGKYKVGKAQMPQNQWNIPSHNASQYGTNLLKEIIGQRFTFPKSLYAVRDCLKHVIKNNKNAIVVDFFAGSGTTGHAIALLNKEDKGNRKYILITNNEVSEEETNKLIEKGYKQGDEEWEKLGIAKYVTWPRLECVTKGININGDLLKEKYLESDIPMSEGFDQNIKFFKCDWTPRKPEEYLLSNALLLHIKELIELHTAKEIDGVRNIILYSKSDYDNYFDNEEKHKLIENVWVNENILFNSSEMKKLKKKKYKYIPREFFSQELKEVGEYV